jgi:hypothetical protein
MEWQADEHSISWLKRGREQTTQSEQGMSSVPISRRTYITQILLALLCLDKVNASNKLDHHESWYSRWVTPQDSATLSSKDIFVPHAYSRLLDRRISSIESDVQQQASMIFINHIRMLSVSSEWHADCSTAKSRGYPIPG